MLGYYLQGSQPSIDCLLSSDDDELLLSLPDEEEDDEDELLLLSEEEEPAELLLLESVVFDGRSSSPTCSFPLSVFELPEGILIISPVSRSTSTVLSEVVVPSISSV